MHAPPFVSFLTVQFVGGSEAMKKRGAALCSLQGTVHFDFLSGANFHAAEHMSFILIMYSSF